LGFNEFKGESHITSKYNTEKIQFPTDVNNYYDVFKYLTGKIYMFLM